MKALVLALALVLGACSQLHEYRTPTTPVEVQQEARKAVDEAYVMVIAVSRVVRSNLTAGIYTQEEANVYQQQLVKFMSQLGDIETAIDAGVPDAVTRAKLMNQLLISLHREVASRARKQP